MAQPVGQQLILRQKKGFWSKFRRGAVFTGIGLFIGGVASVFLPIVPLTVALVAGSVGGGAIANATEGDEK